MCVTLEPIAETGQKPHSEPFKNLSQEVLRTLEPTHLTHKLEMQIHTAVGDSVTSNRTARTSHQMVVRKRRKRSMAKIEN
jgi:hypothetical protein